MSKVTLLNLMNYCLDGGVHHSFADPCPRTRFGDKLVEGGETALRYVAGGHPRSGSFRGGQWRVIFLRGTWFDQGLRGTAGSVLIARLP